MAGQFALCRVYVTAIASADHTSRLIPYSGPGAAFRPTAASLPPKRSIRAWRMLASLARKSPHRASFTARRGSRTTGTRWAASAKRPAQQDRVEHLGPDGHAVRLHLLDDDDLGEPARAQRPDEHVVGGDAEALRAVAVEPQPGGLAGAGVDRQDARHAALPPFLCQSHRFRQARKAIQSRSVTSASYSRVPPSVTWTSPNLCDRRQRMALGVADPGAVSGDRRAPMGYPAPLGRRTLRRVARAAEHCGVADVERRTASGERHDVIDRQVRGSVGGTLVARAPVAVLTAPRPQHAGAEPLPGPRAVQGVVATAVGLAGVLGAATASAAGDDTADRAQLHPRIVDGVAG